MNAGTELKVTVGGLQGKMQLKGKGHTGHEVQIDYFPPLGEDNGLTSLELLMISLASCSGHTVLFLLRKMGKTVEDVAVNAIGNRRMDEHPTVITDIELQFDLKGDKLDAPSVERAIRLSEETYCPVWAMLKSSVALSWKYSIS
ncbi:OsmC family protein [Geobacter sp.]|uniref:OsmC family protein n=1 Tax=Geobacter sp. TaxID=46610 RepID=UPI0026235F4B|nr:OsmC family protein [Geobacter sp.]